MPDLSQFVRADEACRRTGLSERSLDRRIYAGEIPSFRDPRDRRYRLVAVEDLDRLTSVIRFEQDRPATEQRAS